MRTSGRILLGFRNDIDLNQRWWHRLAKVTFILGMCGWALWLLAFTEPDLPDGPGNIRIVETLEDYIKARPDNGNPVADFLSYYDYRKGKRESDGSVSYAYLLGLYCAVKPYEHLYELSRHLRPLVEGGRDEHALGVLQTLKIERSIPAKGYTCIGTGPDPGEIVGWEHTIRAQIVGTAQDFAFLLLMQGVVCLVVMNLYYRGVVYVVCGPRNKSGPQVS